MNTSTAPLVVPIRSLGPSHRGRILEHLLSLDAGDRYLRFGYTAHDENIDRYVSHINFEQDEIFGIYNRRLTLIAVAHLALAKEPARAKSAEFGVSVLRQARGRGYGTRLFERAMLHAQNMGLRSLFIHALSENTAMLRIASHAGAIVRRDGSEAEGHLDLPEPTLDSRMSEIVAEHFAQVDYRFKSQAKIFADSQIEGTHIEGLHLGPCSTPHDISVRPIP